MSRHFFIYALPRSGTAWLSQFLSQPGSFCYHEPLADGAGYTERILGRSEPCVGAIDTSIYQQDGVPLLGFNPNDQFQLYALHRPLSEIRASSEAMGFSVNWNAELERFQRVTSKFRPIYYHLLSDLGYLEDLWFTIVGTKFDRERAEYLMEMNIQRSLQSVINRLRPKL